MPKQHKSVYRALFKSSMSDVRRLTADCSNYVLDLYGGKLPLAVEPCFTDATAAASRSARASIRCSPYTVLRTTRYLRTF